MEDPLASPLRRRLLATGAGAAVSSLLTGCIRSILVQPLPPCQTAPALAAPVVRTPATALTIDTHAHVFNGTDLQIEEFLKRNVDFDKYPRAVVDAVADLLQDAAWDFAPLESRSCKRWTA